MGIQACGQQAETCFHTEHLLAYIPKPLPAKLDLKWD
jgi:hypothetical protein